MTAQVQLKRTGFDVPGLLWTLVRTDFKVRYHGTALGFLWALLKPAAMVAVLVFVFSFIFSSQRDYALRLLVGLFLWEYFAQATKVGLESLRAKSHLVGKTPLPRWLLILVSSSNPLLTLFVVLCAMGVAFVLGDVALGPVQLLCFAFYVACLVMMVLGISLATSVIYLRYRDLNQIWDMAIQAGFFLAPVVWPMSAIPERYHLLLFFWPPTPVIEFSRSVLLDGIIPSARAHGALLLGTSVIVLVGIGIFRMLHAKIAEHL